MRLPDFTAAWRRMLDVRCGAEVTGSPLSRHRFGRLLRQTAGGVRRFLPVWTGYPAGIGEKRRL